MEGRGLWLWHVYTCDSCLDTLESWVVTHRGDLVCDSWVSRDSWQSRVVTRGDSWRWWVLTLDSWLLTLESWLFLTLDSWLESSWVLTLASWVLTLESWVLILWVSSWLTVCAFWSQATVRKKLQFYTALHHGIKWMQPGIKFQFPHSLSEISYRIAH